MKKIIKNSLVLLIILSMFSLIMPCSIKAEEPYTLFIVKDNTLDTADEYSFKSDEGPYPDSTSIPGLIINYESGTETFTIQVNDTVNLKGYVNNDPETYDALLKCDTNLNIVGDGTLNITVVEQSVRDVKLPSLEDSPFIRIKTYSDVILCDEKLTIGGGSSYLNINIDINVPDEEGFEYININGVSAKEMNIKKANMNVNVTSCAFVCLTDKQAQIEDPQDVRNIISIDHSNITINNKIQNSFDINPKQNVGAFRVGPIPQLHDLDQSATTLVFPKGDITINESNVVMTFNDPSSEKNILPRNPAIFLGPECFFNLKESTLEFNSNCNILFILSEGVNIEKCSKVKCVNTYLDISGVLFEVGKFNLTDSNFDFESSGLLVFENLSIPDMVTGSFGKESAYRSFIEIEENSSSYSGKIIINNSQTNAAIFPRATGGQVRFTERQPGTSDPYDYIRISSKGTPTLKTLGIGDGSVFKDNPDFIEDVEEYVFEFIDNDEGDPDYSPSKIAFKRLELNINEEPIPVPSPRHEVLNTGVE